MNVKLINGNSLEILEKMDDESVDLIITDPPYNISKRGNIQIKGSSDIMMNFGEWDFFKTENDYFDFTNKWVSECCRILKENGWFYVFFDYKKLWMLEFITNDADVMMRTLFTWVKLNPATSFRKYNWRSSIETVWVGSKGECRIPNFLSQKEMVNYMITPCRCNYKETEHLNEKPMKITDLFVKTSSNIGDTVLDPFMGSGSVGASAVKLNRNFIGIDLDEKWVEVAKKRIEKYRTEFLKKEEFKSTIIDI
ncbi:MAG: DNA-methyltransferase [Candidatus Odinarchaeia archaeon]|nr:MAG: m4A DNA methyltransferase [Lokiarchaeota virus Fenrir Meg22_1012]URC17239.1 MAG: m4A DNA methyltransferase [Lokiarchaeota virus Fenrir Meg22_1214]